MDDPSEIAEKYENLLQYIVENGLTVDDIRLMAQEAEDDLNGVNDALFEKHLNCNYDNICNKYDAFIKSRACELKTMTLLGTITNDELCAFNKSKNLTEKS